MLTMIGTILAILLAAAWAVAKVVGGKYTTSSPPENKLSVFASSSGATARNAPCLSIVIPCYNEEDRLPSMLESTIKFCNDTVAQCAELGDPDKSRELGHFADFEIIVVDDCSKDGTVAVFEKFKQANPQVKMSVVSVKPNRGKGFAVRSGFFAASGDYVLMADGDGATQISDVCKLLAALRAQTATTSAAQKPFIGVGSRAHLKTEATAKRTFIRTILMHLFHFVVHVTYFAGTRGSLCSIHDTQCGFKLFDRRLCEPIFLNNRLERFAFDVELFILAKRFGLNAVEIPVNWVEVPGSKVNMKAMAQMGLDCLLMCCTYGLGTWAVKKRV